MYPFSQQNYEVRVTYLWGSGIQCHNESHQVMLQQQNLVWGSGSSELLSPIGCFLSNTEMTNHTSINKIVTPMKQGQYEIFFRLCIKMQQNQVWGLGSIVWPSQKGCFLLSTESIFQIKPEDQWSCKRSPEICFIYQ